MVCSPQRHPRKTFFRNGREAEGTEQQSVARGFMVEEVRSSTSTEGPPAPLPALLPKKLHGPLETAALWYTQRPVCSRPSSIQAQSRFVVLPAEAHPTRCQRWKRTRSRHVLPCARHSGVGRTQYVASPTVRYSEQALAL